MEQDDGSGMSHTLWRKYDGMSGRWTSPDPYGGSMSISDPQSFNRYSYVNNDPVNLVDPLGLMGASAGWGSVSNGFWGTDIMSERAWGGRDDIAVAEARHESGVKEAMALHAFRKAWDKQDYDGARRILDASPSVGYEMFSVTVSADVTGVAGEPPNTDVQPDALTSNENLMKQFYCLFKKGGYGFRDTERAAWITKNGDNYNLAHWPWSAADKEESWPDGKPLPDGTIGLVHTHPNRIPRPSKSGGNTGEGDFGASKQIRAPVYVLTRDAIWRQTSINRKSVQTQVAGRDWWKPYEKENCK